VAQPVVEAEAGRRGAATIVLGRPSTLAGRVWRPDGRPATGAVVTLLPDDGGPRIATADAEGHYEFASLAAGSYAVRAFGEGGAPGRAEADLGTGERRTLDLSLEPGGSVHVRVVDARGRPVAGATIVFRTGDGVVPARAPDRAGADGRALRADLPAGLVRVHARDVGGHVGQAAVLVVPGETAPLTITLETGADGR
jgi:hypothetical protein